jgi:hypothetical protein
MRLLKEPFIVSIVGVQGFTVQVLPFILVLTDPPPAEHPTPEI